MLSCADEGLQMISKWIGDIRRLSRNGARLACLAATTGVIGCSVHPLPDDVSRETTISIIQNIRCEAKAEVLRQVGFLLSESSSADVRAIHPENVLKDTKIIEVHDPNIAAKITLYKAVTITYTFKFLITETNNNSFSAKFLSAFGASDRQSSLGLGARANNIREGERNIEILESFDEMDRLDCSKISKPGPDLAYPITGKIGMDEVIRTFLRLSETGAGGKITGVPKLPTNTTFVDKLVFTTEIGGGVAPKIVLDSVPQSFRLVEASGDFSAKRVDQHELTVTLTFPVTATGAPASAKAIAQNPEEVREATKAKAAEELCIQRALNREEQTGVASLKAPETYCRKTRAD